MKKSRAKATLVASIAALAAIGAAWRVSVPGPLRADIVGPASRVARTSPSPSPSASTSGGPATSLAPTATTPTTPTTPPAVATPGLPVSIAIRSLDLEAAVDAVGVKDDGAMEIPGTVDAGWYRFGARPGALSGSAVLAGHVDHQQSPGVFYALRRIAVGAEITVTDDAGAVHRFAVAERFQVAKGELPVAALFRRDGAPVLTLITCGGRFDRRHHQYDDNVVIRAEPLESTPTPPGRVVSALFTLPGTNSLAVAAQR